ncbi:MAG: glycosyltransferase [Methylicorpusculum sp.]|nr:glycosyltransferase [Methylicorpusculum sp.]
MKKPVTISVITATYNAAEALPGLIDSLRAQTDKEFQWVVIDGASTDDTLAFISAATDLNIQWISELDFGIYDALNKAIRQTNSSYYLVLGADDRLKSDAIQLYKEAAHKTDADVITAKIQVNNRLIEHRSGPTWLYGAFNLFSSHAVGAIFKTALHEQFGYYSRKFPITADQLFIKRLVVGGASIYKASFVAGTFGHEGLSNSDLVGTLSETFRVQLETEKIKWLQVALYIVRLIRHYRRL